MQTKSYAADDAADDDDGIHTKNNLSPTPLEGGHNHFRIFNWATYLFDRSPYNASEFTIVVPDLIPSHKLVYINFHKASGIIFKQTSS